MKPAWIVMVCALAVTACSNAPSPPPAPAAQTAQKSTMTTAELQALKAQDTLGSYAGYGTTHFGMDEATFRNAWRAGLNGSLDPAGTCSLLQLPWNAALSDFDFMFEHGRFVRYDVGTPKEIAPGGGRVGMSVSQIRTLYGPGLQVQPSNHMQNEQLLRIADGKGDVLVFETGTDGKVSNWRVGIPPQIDYEDGCL